MKKVLGIMAVVAVSALMLTSCGKSCNCTYFEDGKKVYVQSSASEGTKFFNADACKQQSREKWQGTSIIVDGKEVTKEVVCK